MVKRKVRKCDRGDQKGCYMCVVVMSVFLCSNVNAFQELSMRFDDCSLITSFHMRVSKNHSISFRDLIRIG